MPMEHPAGVSTGMTAGWGQYARGMTVGVCIGAG